MAEGCGAVVTKTTTPVPWGGNPAIRLLPYQKDMILNCEGLPNLGAEAIAREIQLAKTLDPNLILIPSIAAYTKEEFIRMAILLEDAGADGLEIPLMGCPNYRADNPVAQGAWNENPQRAYDLVNGLRKALKLSLWVKGVQNLEMARACEEAGADALLIRSGSLRAIALDPLTGKPLLSLLGGEGSLAGPYTKLPGLKIVAEMVGQVKIPIIGNGGITCGQDVIDYLRVGASAVELLTVIIRKGLSVLPKILCEIEAYLKRHGYKNIGEIRGESLQYIKK
jgi:dihydroorotate dehydrogenase (NAD+) catalytic subunit